MNLCLDGGGGSSEIMLAYSNYNLYTEAWEQRQSVTETVTDFEGHAREE